MVSWVEPKSANRHSGKEPKSENGTLGKEPKIKRSKIKAFTPYPKGPWVRAKEYKQYIWLEPKSTNRTLGKEPRVKIKPSVRSQRMKTQKLKLPSPA